MLGDFASHADEFGIDAIGLIIRRELTQLKELIERSKQIYKPIGAEWHVGEKMWRFPNGARLTFAYIDNDNDADRYMGGSYSRIYVEELGNFPSPAPIFKLMACIRSPNPKVRVGFRATGNPGGPGHCVPFGEVMTPNGWMPIEKMKIGDPVYTVSNSGHLFTSRVDQVHASRHVGDMVHVSARGLSMVCTPNHRVAKIGGIKKDRDRKFSLVPFHKLPGQATILRSVEWEGLPIGRITPEVLSSKKRKLSQPKSLTGIQYAALVGWMVSEGCTVDREKAFLICQMKPDGRKKIIELLDDCGFSYMTQSTVFTCYAMDWWNHFRNLGKCRQKYIPDIVKNATKAELKAFFEAAMMGDGHWASDTGGIYYTISKRLADDMAEVALKLGYIVYTSQRQRPDRDGLSYQINFKKKKSGGTELLTGNHIYDVLTETQRRSDIEVKPFDGMVYCIGVPVTHNFIIRQNGSVWISGNSWIKQRYIMPAPRGMQVIKSKFINPFTNEGVETERVFIPSKVTDNKYNNTPEYVARLQMVGNARLVDAWLLGNWDIIEGAFFDEWNERKHVIDQFIIPAHWTRFTSMDWGSARPFSVGWWAFVPEKFEMMNDHLPSTFDPRFQYKNNLPRGALVRYREWYGCQVDEHGESMHNNVGLKLTVEQLASGIAEREKKEPVNDQGRPRIALRVADPSIFKEDGGPSIGERMAAAPYYQFWTPADNKRVARLGAMGGWDMLRARLIGHDGEPMIYFFPNCVDSIRTLPAAQHDKNNIEDIDCWVAGTLISTPTGMQPIESIEAGMLVDTPLGPRQVLRSYLSGAASTIRIVLSDGRSLEGTAHHKIYVRGKGLVALQDTSCHDILEQRIMSWKRKLLSMLVLLTRGIRDGCTITQMEQSSPQEAPVYTARNGWMPDARYQTGMTSITSMEIMTTTKYPILNVYRTRIMRASIWWKDFAVNLVNSLMNGAAANLDSKYYEKTPRKCMRAPRDVHQRALIVEMLLKRDILANAIAQIRVLNLVATNKFLKSVSSAILNFGQRSTKPRKCEPVHIIAVGRFDEAKLVYNLTVADAHLFYANGFLSSNTDGEDHAIDECRYMAMARPYSRPEGDPDKGRIMTVGPDNQLQIRDVMGDFEKPRDTKFVPYKRI